MDHEPRRPAPRTWVPWAAAALASVGVLVALWTVDYLPTHDGPQHIFTAYLGNHYGDAHKHFHDYFEPSLAITSLGFYALFGALEAIFPWRVAFLLTLSLITLVWGWGYFLLCRALGRQRWALGVLGFVCALQWSIYMGLFSYVLSTGLGFAVLALAIERHPWRPIDRLFIGALLTVQAAVHVFGAQATGVILGLLVLVRHPRKQWPRELGILFAMSLPTLLIAGLATGAPTPTGPSSGDQLTFWDRLQAPAALFVGGPPWRRWPIVALAVAGLASGVLRARKRQASPPELALLAGGAMFLFAAVIAPINMPGWDYLSPRFLPFGVMLSIALLPLEQLSAAAWQPVLLLADAFIAANFLWLASYHRDLRARCADALAGLAAPVERSGARLPIITNPHAGLRAPSLSAAFPFALPLRNIGALYALEQGGVVPYLFASTPRLHPYILKPEIRRALPPSPNRSYLTPLFELEHVAPEERTTILNYMLSYGARFEDVILSGSAEDAALLLARGFVPDWRQGDVVIARFSGCPARLSLTAPGGVTHPVIVAYGWYPHMDTYWTDVIPGGGGDLGVELPSAPCGSIWLRVVHDVDESGGLTPGDGTCPEAAPDGVFLSELSAAHPVISCALAH